MIDTIKMVTMIPFNLYNIIQNFSNVKTSFNNETGQIHYKIVNDNIEGTYSSNLSIRIGEGGKYNFAHMYYLEIEGSYHKIKKGYNSHNGYYNLQFVCYELIKIVENNYKIKLPALRHWFLQRIDIAICYDLKNQANVTSYINNLSSCNYPRRNIKHYEGETVYLTGSTTTIKIYNKLKEFNKHDKKKFKDTNFDISSYLNQIQGFVRFECEIKKPKLKKLYNSNYVRINRIYYKDLKEVWKKEFQKFFKLIENDFSIIRDKEEVRKRLSNLYRPIRAKNLFNFYLLILVEGIQEIKRRTNKSTYYKNISDLRKANIDITQKFDVNMLDNRVEFNPFDSKEII